MTAPRPGLILVRSQPSDPDFTAVDLTAWYEEKHIAEVLATGRVKRAVRYQIANLPARDDVQCQDTGAKMPYLAVYSLEDMNWLHEEGCEFWKLPLTVKHGKGGEEKNIFKVAAFKTEFWDVIGRLDLREDDEETAEPAQHLMLVSLNTKDGAGLDGEDAETLLCRSLRRHPATEGVRSSGSTLLKADETHPCPPSLRGQGAGVARSSMEPKYLCFHEIKVEPGQGGVQAAGDGAVYNLLSIQIARKE